MSGGANLWKTPFQVGCSGHAGVCVLAAALFAGCDVKFNSTEGGGSTSPASGPEQLDSLRGQIAAAQTRRKEVEARISEASAIEAWTLAARPMMPLFLAISHAVRPATKLTELKLVRSNDEPGRFLIDLKATAAPKSQLEAIVQVMRQLGFREQLTTLQDRNGTVEFQSTLVWTPSDPQEVRFDPSGNNSASRRASVSDEVVASATPPDAHGISEEEAKLQSGLLAEQNATRALESQARKSLEYAQIWQPYFAITSEAAEAETGISMKLRASELVVPFRSFKVIESQPTGRRWTQTIPQVVRSEIVIEDKWDKVVAWLEMMEKIKPTMRIFSLAVTPLPGGESWKFDAVLEVPLLKKSPH